MKRILLHSIFIIAAIICSCNKQPAPPPADEFKVLAKFENIINLDYGYGYNFDYTASGYEKNVSVTFLTEVEKIYLQNSFNPNTGKGIISILSSIDNDQEIQNTLVFSDQKNNKINIPVTLKVHGKQNPTEDETSPKINISQTDIKVYEKSANAPSIIQFSIACNNDYVVNVSESKYCDIITNNDGNLYSIQITSKSIQPAGFDDIWNEKITITAENSKGKDQKTLNLSAVLFYTDSFDELWKGDNGEGKSYTKTFYLGSEYGLSIVPDESTKTFTTIDVRVSGTSYTVSCKTQPNPLPDNRNGRFIVTDENGVERYLDFTQKISSVTEDRNALTALYYALNGPNWSFEYGYLTRHPAPHWATDALLKDWEYVWNDWDVAYNPDGSYYFIDGRVYALVMDCNPGMRGQIPDDINKLTALKEFRICYKSENYITWFPDSIMGMTELQDFSICNSKNLKYKKLEDFKFLKEYIENLDGKGFTFSFTNDDLRGSIPEWIIGARDYDLCHNRLSGQVPNKIAKSPAWNKEINGIMWNPYTGKKEQMYNVKYGEIIMREQLDNFALWEGERPECTKFVEDEYGGHWEWTDGRYPLKIE